MLCEFVQIHQKPYKDLLKMKNLFLILTILFIASNEVLAQQNDSQLQQVGLDNNLQTIQNGSSNSAAITQVDGHDALIEQYGFNNSAIINQESGLNSHTPEFPPGNGNPPPFFNGGNDFLDRSSYADIYQNGQQNHASINQSGSHWAQIFQSGLNNLASIIQEGSGSGISFNPPGVANPCPPPFAPCTASSDEGSVASIYQEGDRNNANIEQDLGSNEAAIVQYGSDLEAIIHQFGDNNFASILQDFRGISALNSISGFKSAEIFQSNANNIATVEQSIPTTLPIQIVQDGNMEVHVEHHAAGSYP